MRPAPLFGLTVTVDRTQCEAHLRQIAAPDITGQDITDKIDLYETIVRRVEAERAEELAIVPDEVEIRFQYEREQRVCIAGIGLQVSLNQLSPDARLQLNPARECVTIRWADGTVADKPPVRERKSPELFTTHFDELPPQVKIETFVWDAFDRLLYENVVRSWKQPHNPTPPVIADSADTSSSKPVIQRIMHLIALMKKWGS